MHQEAVEDGIRYSNQGPGAGWYYPLCHICGAEVPNWSYQRGKVYTCRECRAKETLKDREAKALEGVETKENKLETAVKRIKKMGVDMAEYDDAIDAVGRKLHKPGWFESTEEIMVAIELVKNHIKARHQVKLGRYRADFVLTDEKIVLEVDGAIFHAKDKRAAENARDGLITLALGAGWEVVRITDTLVNERLQRLIPAIRAVRDKRQLVRAENGGQLPSWYSDRT